MKPPTSHIWGRAHASGPPVLWHLASPAPEAALENTEPVIPPRGLGAPGSTVLRIRLPGSAARVRARKRACACRVEGECTRVRSGGPVSIAHMCLLCGHTRAPVAERVSVKGHALVCLRECARVGTCGVHIRLCPCEHVNMCV